MIDTDTRPYTISPGDELRLYLRTGALLLTKPSGFVNLNEFVFGIAKQKLRGILMLYDATHFAVLCDVIASSHGLRCSDVRPEVSVGGNAYVCRVESLD